MHLFYQPLISEGKHFLDEEESRHAIKVLRLKEQDIIRIVDGVGNFYDSVILEANQKKCSFQIQKVVAEQKDKSFYIHIAIAPTKNPDRIEWFTEKSVELGIDEISFLSCKNSERKFFNTSRVEKKAISAMKQSLRASKPVVNELISFEKFVNKEDTSQAEKFIGYVDENLTKHLKDTANPQSKYCMLIGPEGDFSSEEIELAKQHQFQPVSLGTNRLRTETAGLASCMIFNIINNF